MLDNLKLAIKNSFIYSLGPLSSKLAGFILIPFYTKQFTTSEFGILGIVDVSMQAIISIFGFGLYWAFNRWYWDKEYKDKQKSMFFTLIIFLIFTNLLIYILFHSAAPTLSTILFEHIKYTYLFKLMVITAGMQIITRIPATLLKLQEKPILFTFANLMRLITSLTLTVYFILFLGRSIEGVYEALIISNLVYLIVLSKYIWINLQLKIDLQLLKEMLYFSIPLVFASTANILFSIADRYILKFLDGLSNVGVYSLGFRLANTIQVFLIQSVILAISPMIYKMMNQPGNKRFYSKIMTYFGLATIFLVIILSSFGKELVILIAKSEEYWNAYNLIPILSFSMFFIAINHAAAIGINIKKLTKIHFGISVSVATLNILLNFCLIYFFNEVGASFSHLISKAIFFYLTFYFAQKYYPIPYEINKIIKMFSLAVLIVLIAISSWRFPFIISLLVRISAILLFPVLLYFANFYEEIEILRTKQFLKKFLRID